MWGTVLLPPSVGQFTSQSTTCRYTHTLTHTHTHTHTQPCRSCQANNCTEESSVGEGSAGVAEGSVGVAGADLVVYVSTVSDGNKCCTFFT